MSLCRGALARPGNPHCPGKPMQNPDRRQGVHRGSRIGKHSILTATSAQRLRISNPPAPASSETARRSVPLVRNLQRKELAAEKWPHACRIESSDSPSQSFFLPPVCSRIHIQAAHDGFTTPIPPSFGSVQSTRAIELSKTHKPSVDLSQKSLKPVHKIPVLPAKHYAVGKVSGLDSFGSCYLGASAV